MFVFGFGRQTGIRFRTVVQTIDRFPEAAQITAQSRAEVGQGQVTFIPKHKGDRCRASEQFRFLPGSARTSGSSPHRLHT